MNWDAYTIPPKRLVSGTSHSDNDSIKIVCRHKTYEGDNHAELLLEILRDRLENFNYLTPGGFGDDNFPRDIQED